MKKNIILASLAILGSLELSAYTYEVNPLIGKNFTEDNALVDDSTAYGLRINKYISEQNAIMFGYTRINDADYKNSASSSSKITRTTSGCAIDPCAKPEPKPCPAPQCKPEPKPCPAPDCSPNNGDNGASNNNGNGSNNNIENGANDNNTNNDGNTEGSDNTTVPTPGTGVNTLGDTASRSTDINRFYINGLHNIKTKYSRLVPYVYGGFGYEHVYNEFSDYDSQGFFNAGGGLKFRVNDTFNLVSDVQGIKKFKNNDFDLLASLGVSFLFGKALQPEPEAVVASGLTDITPKTPERKITVVKVAPQKASIVPVVAAPKGEFYVQMAAGFKTDMETNCKHTQDLRDAGIDYDIKYTTIRGKNAALVLVGPYLTKDEATQALPSLRKYSQKAFIRQYKN